MKRYTISYNFDNCFTRIEESKRNLVNYLIRTTIIPGLFFRHASKYLDKTVKNDYT